MKISRRALLAVPLFSPFVAKANQTVRFGLNWLPQAEMGGFFQAQVKGFFAQEGLAVEFIQGGPQVNNRLALVNGQIDFYLGGNLFQAFAALENNVPTVAIGAFFKKDPQVLMAHPSTATHLRELNTRPVFISKIGMVTFFPWLKAEFGFSEMNVKPYLFNTQGFLADKTSLCQGYLTSEPLSIKEATGLEVQNFMLYDYGFTTPSNLIEVKKTMPLALRQRFMAACVKGWESYKNDVAPAHALLKTLNPELSERKMAYAHHVMQADDLMGDGTISPAIIAAFYAKMQAVGALKPGLDPLKIYESL